MNKFEKYIEWCVGELMELTTMLYSMDMVRVRCDYNDSQTFIRFSTITHISENMDELVVPSHLIPLLDDFGLGVDLYLMVFKKYILKLSDEISYGGNNELYLCC